MLRGPLGVILILKRSRPRFHQNPWIGLLVVSNLLQSFAAYKVHFFYSSKPPPFTRTQFCKLFEVKIKKQALAFKESRKAVNRWNFKNFWQLKALQKWWNVRFCFVLKAHLVLKMFNFLSWLFDHVKSGLVRNMINFET